MIHRVYKLLFQDILQTVNPNEPTLIKKDRHLSCRCVYIAIEKLKSRVIGLTSLTCNFLFVSNRITNLRHLRRITNLQIFSFADLFYFSYYSYNTFPTHIRISNAIESSQFLLRLTDHGPSYIPSRICKETKKEGKI